MMMMIIIILNNNHDNNNHDNNNENDDTDNTNSGVVPQADEGHADHRSEHGAAEASAHAAEEGA